MSTARPCSHDHRSRCSAIRNDGQRQAAAIGGGNGFATIETPTQLRIPSLTDAAAGQPGSLLFVIPGWRETLRINGRLDADDPTVLQIGECFVHCGKAIIRSKLWDEVPPAESTVDVVDRSGAAVRAADASPKGDPPGFIELLDDATVAIPDRRGNRRTDTFHNLVEQPEVALLAIVPGDDRTLELRGTARLTNDITLREAMTMNGRVPHAALVVDVTHCRLGPGPALAAAALWNPTGHVDRGELPTAARIWTDHVKRNRTGGLAAAAIRAAANERVLRAGTVVDYRQNLY